MDTTGLHMDCHITAVNRAGVDQELAQIRERAYAALGVIAGASGSRRMTSGRSRPAAQKPAMPPAGRPARTRAGTNGQVTDETITAALPPDGTNAHVLAGIVGLSHNTVLRRLHQLEKAGAVRREGVRSATRWFPRETVAA